MFEKRVAALEGGTAAVACASGQSAVFQAILCLAHTGDNIVASTALYGGSYSMFKTVLPRIGVTVKWVTSDNAEDYRPLIDDRTKLVFVETVGNPCVSIPDLQAIADIAHEYSVPLMVCPPRTPSPLIWKAHGSFAHISSLFLVLFSHAMHCIG